MKRWLSFVFVLFLSSGAFSQVAENRTSINKATFINPVLVKLVEGQGNVWRIGFVQQDQLKNNDESTPRIQQDDKCFVYFPLSTEPGEITLVSRSTVTELGIDYDKAIEMIMADSGK